MSAQINQQDQNKKLIKLTKRNIDLMFQNPNKMSQL
jgi:hypothetical protein